LFPVIFSFGRSKAVNIERWMSFSISTDGVYFPSSVSGEFVLAPWRYIGEIERGIFGLIKRG